MYSIGKRLKLFRQALGINQDVLAEKCHVTSRTVCSWENEHKSMGIDKAEILVSMGANPHFILCGKGEILQREITV